MNQGNQLINVQTVGKKERYQNLNEEPEPVNLGQPKQFDLTEDTLEAVALREFKDKLSNRAVPQFIKNLKAATIFFCVIIISVAGVDAIGSFNNRTLAISSLGVLLLQLGFNSTPDIPTKELTDQFSKELLTLQENQNFLNSTRSQLAIVPVLDKTEVLVEKDEAERLHISSNKISFVLLLDAFVKEGLRFVEDAHKSLVGEEFDNRIQFLSKVANGPLFQGADSIAKEFYADYTEKTQGFKGLFRVLVITDLLVIVLWNLIVTGTLYYLKNTNKRFLKLFDGYVRLSKAATSRNDSSQLHEKETEDVHLQLDTLGGNRPKRAGSVIVLEKDDIDFKRSDSVKQQPAHPPESILDTMQFQLSIKRTVRQGSLILISYLLVLGWMTYREEIFLDKIVEGLAHINHLENRVSAIQNLNNMAIYESVVHQPPIYSGVNLKDQSIYAVINEEKRINQTAMTLRGGSFDQYLKLLYDFNHFDVCKLLYEGKSETQQRDCQEVHQGELKKGITKAISVLNRTILSSTATDELDYMKRVLDEEVYQETLSYMSFSYAMEYLKFLALTSLTLGVAYLWFLNFKKATHDVWATKDVLSKVSAYEIRQNENLFDMIRQKDFLDELE